MFDRPVEEMSVEETLDTVEVWHGLQTRAEIATFVAAAHYADLHHRDARPRQHRVPAGTEQTKQLGGPGTPAVAEFAAAAFGARIGKSPYVGRTWIADALDVRHRLPTLWGRVRAGEVPVGYARHVAQQTRELSQQAAGVVDAEVAAYADGRLCWSRFADLVAGKVIDADPDAAAEKERDAAEAQFAKVSRTSEHGHKTLYVRTAAAAMVRIDATIAYLADALAALGDHGDHPDGDDEDTRRAKAVLIMANPTQALQLLAAFAAHRSRPTTDPTGDTPTADTPTGGASGDASGVTQRFLAPFRPADALTPAPGLTLGFDPRDLLPPATLYLHLHADTLTDRTGGVARWEGQGPVSSHYIAEFLGPAAHFTIKPVIHPDQIAPVDAYEIPDRHREAVHIRTPADTFPYASATTTRDGRRRKHLDHTRPYLPPETGGPPGQTAVANLGPMTAFHHRIKTFGQWQLKQPFDGIYLWRDPHGRTYLVDHTGTRTLGTTPPANTDTPDTTLHLHPDRPDLPCEYQARHAA